MLPNSYNPQNAPPPDQESSSPKCQLCKLKTHILNQWPLSDTLEEMYVCKPFRLSYSLMHFPHLTPSLSEARMCPSTSKPFVVTNTYQVFPCGGSLGKHLLSEFNSFCICFHFFNFEIYLDNTSIPCSTYMSDQSPIKIYFV